MHFSHQRYSAKRAGNCPTVPLPKAFIAHLGVRDNGRRHPCWNPAGHHRVCCSGVLCPFRFRESEGRSQRSRGRNDRPHTDHLRLGRQVGGNRNRTSYSSDDPQSFAVKGVTVAEAPGLGACARIGWLLFHRDWMCRGRRLCGRSSVHRTRSSRFRVRASRRSTRPRLHHNRSDYDDGPPDMGLATILLETCRSSQVSFWRQGMKSVISLR